LLGLVLGLLEGRNVNLRIMEKEDLPLFAEWINEPEVFGEYNPIHQMSKAELEKMLDNPGDFQPFIIEKKDSSKIGFIAHFNVIHTGTGTKQLEVGYSLVPKERGKGYGTEALQIMLDYLFLSKNVARIQVQTDVRNAASQNIIEKVGFKKEGILRKNFFMRGELRDCYIYSILREEWKEPRTLSKIK